MVAAECAAVQLAVCQEIHQVILKKLLKFAHQVIFADGQVVLHKPTRCAAVVEETVQ